MSRFRVLWRNLLFGNQAASGSVTPPTPNFLTSLLTLDVAFQGKPYNAGTINVADVPSLQKLDLAYLGMPFNTGVL